MMNKYLDKAANIAIKPSHEGDLHKRLGIPEGEKIPSSVLAEEKAKAKASGDTKKLRQIVFAENARKWRGGSK